MPTPSNLEELTLSVSPRAWRYLSSRASVVDLSSTVEDLFRLPRGEVRRLAAVHLGLQAETGEMLNAAERLLRELPSIVHAAQEEMHGRVRPPVIWSATQVRRRRTGDPSVF